MEMDGQMMDRKINKYGWIDRQIDRQIDDRQIYSDRQMDGWMDGQTDKQIWMERQIDNQI